MNAQPLASIQPGSCTSLRAGTLSFEPQLGRSVSIDRATTILRVSRRTVYNWIREGRLATVRTLGGSQRVVIESLRPHLERQRDECAA